MIKKILVTIECNEENCRSSDFEECEHLKRKPLSDDFYCRLFHVNLESEQKRRPNDCFVFETKRCNQCKAAEQ